MRCHENSVLEDKRFDIKLQLCGLWIVTNGGQKDCFFFGVGCGGGFHRLFFVIVNRKVSL